MIKSTEINNNFYKNNQVVQHWFDKQNWKSFEFQQNTWNHIWNGHSGLVNAPTGSGKTYSVLLARLAEAKVNHLETKGLKLIWITPIRALAKEIQISSERAIEGFGLNWRVGIRSGDSSTSERKKQIEKPPEILITTPESLHIILASKTAKKIYDTVDTIVVDEWHELLGSKRGTQTELFLAYMKSKVDKLRIWGISATIGNMDQAMQVLLGNTSEQGIYIKADIKKEIEIVSILPDEMDTFPWAGHIGLTLLDKLIPIIRNSQTTLIFTNTRAQCEIWYQKLLDAADDLSGLLAMHHGSISKEIRTWVEGALYVGKLKAVVCTSSLDLGVDFRPVETIVQIGSPKGIARFMQRAGRSGHSPGKTSKIFFLPTNALELIEISAIRTSIENNFIEDRMPYLRSWDVLIQFLMTCAVGGGFQAEDMFLIIKKTFAFDSIEREEWNEILHFLEFGSNSLEAYDDYKKIVVHKNTYTVENKRMAMRHRMSIGTIVGESLLRVKYVTGKTLGSIEEWIAGQLQPGDVFWFAGRALEFVRIKDNIIQVKKSNKKNGRITSYMGGRMSLSSQISEQLRNKIYAYHKGGELDLEIQSLVSLFEIQKDRSILPKEDEFLIEYFESKEGFHLVFYPFEGRNVHEGMGALIAQRISSQTPITFTIAMNDYGFELLSDQKLDVDKYITQELFDYKNLVLDIQSSINSVELAKRKFRDISRISGLIFAGFPGKLKKERHLQSSAQLLFEVFREYEPDNFLFLQTYEEVMTFQLEEARLRKALGRIQKQKMIISKPDKATPFSFPLMVDRLREKISTERLIDRIEKMKGNLLKS